jgi:hypothetical protein
MPTDSPAAPGRRRPDRGRALGTALAALAVVAAVPLLWVGVRELADRPDVDQVALQLAGGREAACRVLQPGAPGCPVAGDAVRRYRSAVQADGFLLAGWVLAGLGVFGLSALFLSGSGARRVARWCLGGVLLAAAADAGENLALLGGLSGLGGNGGDNTWFAAAASLSVLKFAVGGPLLPVFVVFAGVLLGRRLSRRSRVRRGDGGTPEIATAGELEPGTARRPDIILPPAVADASTATLSATVGHSGPTSSSSCTTSSRRTPARGARRRPWRPPAPAAAATPARRRTGGAPPAGCRRAGRRRRSASAPRGAGSARPRSPSGRCRRCARTSCPGPATWCRCRAGGT